jgi:hypothetical protein
MKMDEFIENKLWSFLSQAMRNQEDAKAILSVMKYLYEPELTSEFYIGEVLWMNAESPPTLRFVLGLKHIKSPLTKVVWDVYLIEGTPKNLINIKIKTTEHINKISFIDQVTSIELIKEIERSNNPPSFETYIESAPIFIEIPTLEPTHPNGKSETPTLADYGYGAY